MKLRERFYYTKTGALLALASFALTARAGELIINTDPARADIYVSPLNENKLIKVGVAPFNRSISEIISAYIHKSAFVIEVQKEGYVTKRYILPSVGSTDVSLMVNLEINDNLKVMRQFDSLANQLFEAQRQIRGKNYDKALQILDKQENLFPQVSIIPELSASAYYLQKDLDKSLDAYKKAVAINSENLDAFKMKLFLEKSMGLKADAKRLPAANP